MKKGEGGFMELLLVAILLGTIIPLAPKKVSYCSAISRLSFVLVCFHVKML